MKKKILIMFFLVIIPFFIIKVLHSQDKSDKKELQETKPFFTEVTDEAGLKDTSGFRISFIDVDNDGYPDIVNVNQGFMKRDFLFLYLNTPDPKDPSKRVFVDNTLKSNIRANRKSGIEGRCVTSAIFVDVNNDGFLDLVSTAYWDEAWQDNGDRNEILLNQKDGTFQLAKSSAFNEMPPTTIDSVCLFDYDKDGILDLFIINWFKCYQKDYREGRRQAFPQKFLKGNGDGAFIDITEKAGISEKESAVPAYGITHCDFDKDGNIDVMVCSYGTNKNYLWRNNGDGTFTNVAGDKKFDIAGNGFGISCGDFNNDGNFDAYLANVTHSYLQGAHLSCIMVNQGKDKNYSFKEEPGLIVRTKGYRFGGSTWDVGDHCCAWFDYDNDGLLDLLVAPSTYCEQYLALYKQMPDHTFVDITTKAGLKFLNPEAISLADFDRDGYVDILVSTGPGRWDNLDRKRTMHLFKNNVERKNNWLNVVLEGKSPLAGKSNKNAIGAVVEIKTGDLVQIRQVVSTEGQCGAQIGLDLRFGFGTRDTIDYVKVRWPNKNNTEQIFKDVKINSFIKIIEDESEIIPLN